MNIDHQESGATPSGKEILGSGQVAIESNGKSNESEGFGWIAGRPILLSAPHAVTHFREGAPKREEPGTDLLAAGVASHLGLSAIWATRAIQGDPNWDDDHPYKTLAAELGHGGYALDLHLMMDRGFDICLGLGEMRPVNRSLWTHCVDAFVAADYTVSINYPFSAGPRTITSHLQRCAVNAIQIEMTWDVCSRDRRGAETAELLLKVCNELRVMFDLA